MRVSCGKILASVSEKHLDEFTTANEARNDDGASAPGNNADDVDNDAEVDGHDEDISKPKSRNKATAHGNNAATDGSQLPIRRAVSLAMAFD